MLPGTSGCGDFGVVTVGSKIPLALTVVNLGDVGMDTQGAGLVADVAPGDGAAVFGLVDADNGCLGAKLAANASCVVRPTATGVTVAESSSATLRLGMGAVSTAPSTTYTLNAKVLHAAELTFDPSPDGVFAVTPVTGHTIGTSDKTFTISNGSGADYARTGAVTVSVTGANANQFKIIGTTCPSGVGLPSAGSCMVTVRFAPTALSSPGNAFTATLNVAANPGGPKTLALQGTSVSSLSLYSGSVKLGKTMVMPTFMQRLIVNLAGTAAATAPLKTSVSDPAFTLIDDQCYGKILSDSIFTNYCYIDVKYTGRTTNTAKVATLTVDGGSDGQKVTLDLSYTGAEANRH